MWGERGSEREGRDRETGSAGVGQVSGAWVMEVREYTFCVYHSSVDHGLLYGTALHYFPDGRPSFSTNLSFWCVEFARKNARLLSEIRGGLHGTKGRLGEVSFPAGAWPAAIAPARLFHLSSRNCSRSI